MFLNGRPKRRYERVHREATTQVQGEINMKVDATVEEANNVLTLYKNNTKIDPESGALRFGNLPVIWARADFISNIFTELENLVGQSATSVMKRIGKVYGSKFYELLKKGNTALFIDDNEKLYRYICAETQAIGWGQMSIEEKDDEIIITSKGFASGTYFKSTGQTRDSSIDAYFLGYFEGFFREMHRKKFDGEEVECVAKGDDQCKMVFTITTGI
jgi:predicted hydrocarbon binding protein